MKVDGKGLIRVKDKFERNVGKIYGIGDIGR